MLSVKNIYSGYGNRYVIEDISFEIDSNQNLSIIGPNGCGKTTLLKTISNLISFKGEIEINGLPIKKMKPKEMALKISLLSQMSEVYFPFTVFETVMMGRYVYIKDGVLGLPSKNDIEIVTEWLERLNLLDIKDKEITKLSGGQFQRVLLARTLVQEPEIILLDEPTNHLDIKYQIELIDYLKEWSKESGRIVIGVLHDINLAIHLSEKLLVMKCGRIKAHGKFDEIIKSGILQDVYETDVSEYMKTSLKKWI